MSATTSKLTKTRHSGKCEKLRCRGKTARPPRQLSFSSPDFITAPHSICSLGYYQSLPTRLQVGTQVPTHGSAARWPGHWPSQHLDPGWPLKCSVHTWWITEFRLKVRGHLDSNWYTLNLGAPKLLFCSLLTRLPSPKKEKKKKKEAELDIDVHKHNKRTI